MNRFVVIGLGNFGATIARRLYEIGHDVIAIDIDPAVVDANGPYVTRAIAGDATRREVLDEAGAGGADVAIVAIGDDLGSSVLSMLSLRDVGCKATYIKVISEDHRRIADALGATDTVFPEKEAAQNLASRICSGKLLRYTAYGDQFGIQEMAVPDAWVGKTLRTLQLPQEFQIQVVAIHDLLRDTITVPSANQPLTPSDTLLIAGAPEQLERLTALR